jgi:hypothetical protein
MATQIKTILRFTDLEVGVPVSVPHDLNIDGVDVVPDLIALNMDGFTITSSDGFLTDVTVERNDGDPDAVDLYIAYWHTDERVFGPHDQFQPNKAGTPTGAGHLIPHPFIIRGGMGAAMDGDELVKVTAADTASEYLDDKVATPAGSGLTKTVFDTGGGDLELQLKVEGADAGNIETGPPITVRGPTNAEGDSDELARANHDHRLEYEVEDEGVLVSARPRMDFVGDGVGAVDVPGEDLTRVTIPGPNLGDGGAVVKRSTYVEAERTVSQTTYQDGMIAVTVPIDGSYWVMFEGEGANQSNGIQVEIAISVNNPGPGGPVVAGSERLSEGNASDLRPLVTTVQVPNLTAGDIIRVLFRRVGGGGMQMVSMFRRHLTIMKVQ